MNFTFTLASAGTYDIQSEGHVVSELVLQNDPNSAGNVYYGRVDQTALATLADVTIGAVYIDVLKSAISGNIRQGMLIVELGANLLAANTKVTRTEDRPGGYLRVHLDQAATGDGSSACSFTAPVTSETGIAVVPGEKVFFTPALHRPFLQQGFRVLTATGETATVRICKLFN